MSKRLLPAVAVILLVACPVLAQTPPASDPDLVKAIRLVEEGEFAEGIILLDQLVPRFLKSPSASQDLTQAYLYLGVAYLGKGHESAARARFRDALAQVKDLRLTSERFAPKVIELFEQARAEAAKPSAPARATTAPEEGKKGGSKTLLFVGAGAVVVGAGVAVAAGGGGGGSPSASNPTPPTPAPPVEAQYTISGPAGAAAPSEVGGILRVSVNDRVIGEYNGGPTPIPPIPFRALPGARLTLQARSMGDAYFLMGLAIWKEGNRVRDIPPIPKCSLPSVPCPVAFTPTGIVFFEDNWVLP